jgi:hypothetical protein
MDNEIKEENEENEEEKRERYRLFLLDAGRTRRMLLTGLTVVILLIVGAWHISSTVFDVRAECQRSPGHCVNN